MFLRPWKMWNQKRKKSREEKGQKVKIPFFFVGEGGEEKVEKFRRNSLTLSLLIQKLKKEMTPPKSSRKKRLGKKNGDGGEKISDCESFWLKYISWEKRYFHSCVKLQITSRWGKYEVTVGFGDIFRQQLNAPCEEENDAFTDIYWPLKLVE